MDHALRNSLVRARGIAAGRHDDRFVGRPALPRRFFSPHGARCVHARRVHGTRVCNRGYRSFVIARRPVIGPFGVAQ